MVGGQIVTEHRLGIQLSARKHQHQVAQPNEAVQLGLARVLQLITRTSHQKRKQQLVSKRIMIHLDFS